MHEGSTARLNSFLPAIKTLPEHIQFATPSYWYVTLVQLGTCKRAEKHTDIYGLQGSSLGVTVHDSISPSAARDKRVLTTAHVGSAYRVFTFEGRQLCMTRSVSGQSYGVAELSPRTSPAFFRADGGTGEHMVVTASSVLVPSHTDTDHPDEPNRDQSSCSSSSLIAPTRSPDPNPHTPSAGTHPRRCFRSLLPIPTQPRYNHYETPNGADEIPSQSRDTSNAPRIRLHAMDVLPTVDGGIIHSEYPVSH